MELLLLGLLPRKRDGDSANMIFFSRVINTKSCTWRQRPFSRSFAGNTAASYYHEMRICSVSWTRNYWKSFKDRP